MLVPTTREEFAKQFERAQQFFDARRYADARGAFALLRGAATEDDRRLVELRIGECDFFAKRYAAARDALEPLVGERAEAEFYYISALRGLGRHDDYVARTRAFIEGHPAHALAEALDGLATHFILPATTAAAEIFTERTRFPKANWAARRVVEYKNASYADAVQIRVGGRELAARLPSVVHSAARAPAAGERDAAAAGFMRVISAYRNSPSAAAAAAPPCRCGQIDLVGRPMPLRNPGERLRPPPHQRPARAAGCSTRPFSKSGALTGLPLLDATIACLEPEGRFAANIRCDLPCVPGRGRRTAAAGNPPGDFPIAYWDLISARHERHLDPYLMAALSTRESFQADVKSSAGAWDADRAPHGG